MEASITINFAGGTAATNLVQILVAGGTIALDPRSGVTLAVPGVTNIAVGPGSVGISGPVGGRFSGTLMLLLGWSSGVPSVTLDNLVPTAGNPATITWPTASGLQVQILTPGDPMPLTGLIGS